MAAGASDPATLVFRLHEGTPELVREVLLERGWVEYDERDHAEGDWNLHWRTSAFRNADYQNILPWQRLNHHPKTVGITRKDCLARNLRRMRATFGSALYNFSPKAFILPNDYTRFLAEYAKTRLDKGGRAVYWICKPVDLSRGRGIFIFEDIKDLMYDSSVIVQRYISDPMLIAGYKFDLRIYVCVTSFQPLTIYMHQEGLVRFATEKYNLASLDNHFSHLTNTSINKFGPFYTCDKERVGPGCKWTMSKFRCFLHSQGINEPLLWQRINNIVTLTLLTIAPSVPLSPNCVELFGFDVLLDSKLKPWLLEVNYSPALSLDCPADVTVKKGLINDLIDLMNYQKVDSLRQRGYVRRHGKRPCCTGSGLLQAMSPVMCDSPTDHQRHSPPSLKPLYSRRVGHSHSKFCMASIEIKHIVAAQKGRTDNSCFSFNPICMQSPDATTVEENQRASPSLSKTLEPFQWTEAICENRALSPHKSAKSPLRPTSMRLCKLPAIHIQKYKPPSFLWDHKALEKGRPLCRVGDFILTFPFNEVTLKASQNKLNMNAVVQEVRKLLNRLVTPCGHNMKRQRESSLDKCEERDGFAPLFWGPKNPPLLSDCCSTRS